MPMIENEPVLPVKLAAKDAGAGLPAVIPEGMRAVSVRVNEVIGVAGYVLPGTHVDVLATASPTGSGADTTTKIVLTNVQVLAAGTKMEQDTEQGKPMAVNVVTLLVTPEESERLTLASTEGKIQLALRNPLDKSDAGHTRHSPGRAARHRRARAPRREHVLAVAPRGHGGRRSGVGPTVEMIRGDKRNEEVVR